MNRCPLFMKPALLSLALCAALSARAAEPTVPASAPAATPPTAAEPKATASFVFTHAGKPIPIWSYVPADATAKTPIVIALHGIKRDADVCFADLLPHARERGFVLIVPEFSEKEFPSDDYITGHVRDASGTTLPKAQWAFSALEKIFDEVRTRTHNETPSYYLYGHSAGGQFVQRLLLFLPDARIARAVVANAGFYTLPDFTGAYPYGLKDTPVTEDALRHMLTQHNVLLLGTADIDPKARALRHSPEAEAQGPFRFARGKFFFAQLEAAAHARKLDLGWHLETAPGVAHSDHDMAPFAMKALFAQ